MAQGGVPSPNIELQVHRLDITNDNATPRKKI